MGDPTASAAGGVYSERRGGVAPCEACVPGKGDGRLGVGVRRALPRGVDVSLRWCCVSRGGRCANCVAPREAFVGVRLSGWYTERWRGDPGAVFALCLHDWFASTFASTLHAPRTQPSPVD